MKRRSFLTTAAITLAGCVGSEPDTGGSGEEPSADAAPVKVTDRNLIHEGKDEDASVRAELTVTNQSDSRVGEVVATATFVTDETLQGSWTAVANGMAPGQEWLVSITDAGATGADAQAVDGVRAAVEERTPADALLSSHLTIRERDLIREGEEIAIKGVAENTGKSRLEYATVNALFVADGLLVGQTLSDTTRDVNAGQQFTFRTRYTSPARPASAIKDCQLTTEATVEESHLADQ